jgi:NitT/TauT family transport system permease protein
VQLKTMIFVIAATLAVIALGWWLDFYRLAIIAQQVAAGVDPRIAEAEAGVLGEIGCLLFTSQGCAALAAPMEGYWFYPPPLLWLAGGLAILGVVTPQRLAISQWWATFFWRVMTLVILVLLWWLAARQAGRNLVPTPLVTLFAAIDLFDFSDGRIYGALRDSLAVYFSGYGIAILIGIPFGLLLGGFRPLGRTLEVYVYALMATPRVAFIPLIILFLGLGYNAKVFIVFLGAIMPIIVNTYVGVLNADGELVEMAHSAGARRGQIFVRILLPGALPFIVVGLRLGATIGLINTIVAELYTAVSGLGGLLAIYGNTFRMAPYFVVVLCLSVVGVVVTQLLRLIEARTDRWKYRGGG